MEFKELITEIITGLENGTFERYADEPAKGDADFQDAVNVAADLLLEKRYTKWHLLATEAYIRKTSARVTFGEIRDYLYDHFLLAGSTVADALESYASDDPDLLGDMYRALDRAGGVNRFDWGAYADDGITPTENLSFVVVPAPAGEDRVFLFQD